MMNETIIYTRNQIINFFYKNILKPIFFLIDPEVVHNYINLTGRFLGSNYMSRKLTALFFSYYNKTLEQKILGIKFSNPVGLSAGFDKNAVLTNILPSVGFGFAEVGTITGEACRGNPKPRLWRLKKSKSLVVNYGLKNDGSEKISNKLKKVKFTIPIITSIGKTNNITTIETKKGIEDYVKAYRRFTNIGNIFDINISCPNTFGGQPFSDPKKLDELLEEIDKIPTNKPVFIKMPPDLIDIKLDEILRVIKNHKIAGFICTNLTKSRKNNKIMDKNTPDQGGISGKVVEDLSNELIKIIYQKTKGKYVIIGCGGISSAEDAYKKIKMGASLVQLITGMIFEGPQVISKINQGLVKLLKEEGYENISQAVGKGSA